MRLAPAARLARAPSPARRASLVGAALLLGVAACDPPNAPDRVRLRPLVAAGNSCGGFAPAQIPGAAGLDPTSEEALTLWRNYLLTERVNGYLPAGVYTIRNYWHVPGYDNVPFLTFWPEWTDRGPRTICGDGDATVIKLDLSASPERDLEIGVYIMSTNATVRDLKLEGTSYSSAARAEWKGGTAVMVSNADYVRVTNLTIDNWGHNGVFLFRSASATVDGNRIDMRKGILSMGVQIYEDRGSPTAPYIGGANVIRDNAIRNTKFECIIITGSSLNTVLSNTLDTCVDGVTVQGWSGDGEPRVVTGNVVRNNRITNAGGPEYVSGVPPFPDGERYGHGVHIYFQAIATTVVGNVITDMRKDGGSGSHRHGIKLASTSATADTGNVVLANTVSWTTRSPHGATRGIMSVAPRTLINFNVVKNAPQAIQVGQSTTEVKGNYVLNNGAAVSWQTAPASGWPFACNRMVNTGTSNYAQGTCVISSSGNPTTAMSTTLANPASYYSDVDCKGVEHVLASLPNSWNTTGVRRTTAVSNQWAGSRRDAGGNCSNSAPGYISSYPVYR